MKIKVKSRRNGATKIPKGLFTRDQFHQAIEKARLEERTKLKSKLGSSPDALAAVKKEVEKQYKKKLSKLERTVQQLDSENRSQKARKFVRKIVDAYDGQVIPSLIVGDSEDELLESARLAHKEWVRAMKTAKVSFDEVKPRFTSDEDEDEDEDDDELESSDEDEDEEDEEEEDDEEEDDEEDEDSNSRHLKRFKKTAGIHESQPVSLKKSQGRGSVVSLPNGRMVVDRNGTRRQDNEGVLRNVRSLSLREYGANREKILGAVARRYGTVPGAGLVRAS